MSITLGGSRASKLERRDSNMASPPTWLEGEKSQGAGFTGLALFEVEGKLLSTGVKLWVTNYRCFIRAYETGDISISNGSIIRIEKLGMSGEYDVVGLLCKDTASIQIGFTDSASKKMAIKHIQKFAFPTKVKSLFCFIHPLSAYKTDGWKVFTLEGEFKRMGLNPNNWKIIGQQAKHSICNTYPSRMFCPSNFDISQLLNISTVRSKGRVPALLWSNGNNSFLLRMGQSTLIVEDMTGYMEAVRPKEDDKYLQTVLQYSTASTLTIVEMATKNKDYEDSLSPFVRQQKHYYQHFPDEVVIRDYLSAVVNVSQNIAHYKDGSSWLEAIDKTGWLEMVFKVLDTSSKLATKLHDENETVIVQNQDGDGLVSVIAAMIQILADPYYRTLEGFPVVIEKTFSYGHKFNTHVKKKDEDPHSALFLLLLDSVAQCLQMFPHAFEYTECLLLEVIDAVYSCRFGNFLFTCEREAIQADVMNKTPSVWAYILDHADQFRNPLFIAYEGPLRTYVKDKNALRLWNGYFLRHSCRVSSQKLAKQLQTAASKPSPNVELCKMKAPNLPSGYLRHLTQTTYLNLADNFLSQFPHELAELKSLKCLHLQNNLISYIPEDYLDFFTKEVPGLEELNLNNNQLFKLSDKFTRFKHLRVLKVHANNISVLPDLSDFAELEELDIGANALEIGKIPDEVIGMQHLRLLDVSKTNISVLPADLARLPNLVSLNVSHNNITALPENFASMTQLEELDLSGNKLQLPQEIFQFSNLRKLGLAAMGLGEEIPPEISLLTQLESFDVSENRIKKIDNLLNNSNLRCLYLQNNILESVPFEILRLDNMVELNLSHNRLTGLTPGVGKLENLRVLDVSNNMIRDLPGTIGYLDKLLESKQFRFANNELRTPSKDIIDQGYSAVFRFLKSLLDGAVRCYRMKLMIVGQENVGKTSLLRCLKTVQQSKKSKLKGDAHLDKTLKKATGLDSLSTDGIDIDQLQFKVKFPEEQGKKTSVELSVWDFAGQELYYTSHQFFLSDRAVYILVYNMAKNEEDSRVEYWLKSIKARAKNAPIIIVGTHLDDPKCQNKDYVSSTLAALEAKYYPDFPNIQAIIPVSCANQRGVNDVDLWIQCVVATQPHMGELIPKKYLELESMVQQEAGNMEPPVVRWDVFAKMGRINNIVEPEDLKLGAALLHNLGSLVNFQKQKGLEDIFILNPQWLTNVMSTIITTKHQSFAYTRTGVLEHSQLPMIWKPPEFPPDLHEVLLQLLESFEISYFLRSTKVGNDIYSGKSLIPCMLPEEKPAEINQVWARFPQPTERQFGRQYEFGFIPHGFVSRLLCRLLHFAEPLYSWRYGMLIEKSTAGIDEEGFGDYLILVEMLPARRLLEVTIRGESGAKLAQIIIETINALIEGWYSLSVQIYIPCIHCIREKMYDPFVFTLEGCEQAAIDGKSIVKCNEIRPIRLDELAPDVAMTHVANCRIEYSDLTVNNQIGEGGFALVYKGTYQNKVVAIKKIKFGMGGDVSLTDTSELQAFSEFRREVWIMSGLVHMNIVQLAGFTMDPFCIVTEFMHHGNLYDLIHDTSKELTWGYRWRCAMDMAKGMEFLHNTMPPVIHRDLKTPNVLLSSLDERAEAVAKVADFGLSQALASTTQGRSVANPVWLAPEIMKNEEYTEKADIYSYGVMLWELASREDFFGECKFMSALENKVIEGERPPIPRDTPDIFADMIRRCWADKPDDRPTFTEVVAALAKGIKKFVPNLYEVATANKDVVVMHKKPKEASNARHIRTQEEIEEEQRQIEEARKKAAAEEMQKISKRLEPDHTNSVQVMVHVPSCAGSTGQVWSGASDGTLTMWSEQGKKMDNIKVHADTIFSILLHGDTVWTSSGDQTVKIHLPSRMGKAKKEIKNVHVLCLARVGKYVWGGSSDAYVYIFDPKSGKQKKKAKIVENGPICSLLSLEQQGLVWCGTDIPGKTIVRTSAKNAKVVDFKEGHSKKVSCMLEVNGMVWSCSADRTIRLWDIETFQCLKILKGHTGPIYGMILHSDKVWSCSWDKTIIIWDATYQTFFKEYEAHNDAVSCLSSVQNHVWSGSWDKSIRQWTPPTR